MFSMLKTGLLGLSLGAGLLLVGCQSGGAAQAPVSHEMASGAVQCDTCKVTWVKVPEYGKGMRITGYTTRKEMECPECKSAVENFFATGNLKHECKACGGNMAVCEAH